MNAKIPFRFSGSLTLALDICFVFSCDARARTFRCRDQMHSESIVSAGVDGSAHAEAHFLLNPYGHANRLHSQKLHRRVSSVASSHA